MRGLISDCNFLPSSVGPAVLWEGAGPNQAQFNLLRPNWPRIYASRLVRQSAHKLPTAIALPVRRVGHQLMKRQTGLV